MPLPGLRTSIRISYFRSVLLDIPQATWTTCRSNTKPDRSSHPARGLAEPTLYMTGYIITIYILTNEGGRFFMSDEPLQHIDLLARMRESTDLRTEFSRQHLDGFYSAMRFPGPATSQYIRGADYPTPRSCSQLPVPRREVQYMVLHKLLGLERNHEGQEGTVDRSSNRVIIKRLDTMSNAKLRTPRGIRNSGG